jgi:hypothetical protein
MPCESECDVHALLISELLRKKISSGEGVERVIACVDGEMVVQWPF